MVNPGFAGQKIVPSTIDKARRLQVFLKEREREDIIVEVDGNITPENGHILRQFGASVFVAGSSSIFRGKLSEYAENIEEMRRMLK